MHVVVRIPILSILSCSSSKLHFIFSFFNLINIPRNCFTFPTFPPLWHPQFVPLSRYHHSCCLDKCCELPYNLSACCAHFSTMQYYKFSSLHSAQRDNDNIAFHYWMVLTSLNGGSLAVYSIQI